MAVRIRPLLVRELHLDVSSIEISPDGKELVVNDNLKKFTFKLDHCLDKNTSQSSVFTTIAQPLLDAAFNGYNVCLFAYGQTGSGKSYSMMGDNLLDSSLNEKTGIIPRFCHQLFDQIPSNMVAQMKVSYLEIYNEVVYDLLSSERKALKVRERSDKGVFVSDLSIHTVSSFGEIQKWLSEGNKARVTASTCMNDKSSRSHSIFQIQLTLTEDTGASVTQKCSQINLVDLAGSERVAQTGATEERFKEGKNINLSLMTLGQVITTLSDNSGIPPYRNSNLTYLLKDSLGGNSRTTMLATINPLQSHIEESLATLRYALQARNIVNTIRKNQEGKETCLRCQNVGLLDDIKFKECHLKITDLQLEAKRRNEYFCNLEFENEQLLKSDDLKTKKILEFEEAVSKIMKQKEELQEKLVSISKAKEEDQAELCLCKDELTQIKREFRDLQDKYQLDLNQKTEAISSLRNQNLALKLEYEEKIDRKDAKIKELMNGSSEIGREMSDKNAEIARLRNENEKLSMDLVYKENKEVTDLMKEVDRKDVYINTLLKENEENVKLCQTLERQMHGMKLNEEFDRLNHEIVHKDEEIRQNAVTIKQLTTDTASRESSMKKLINQNIELAEKVKTLEESKRKLDECRKNETKSELAEMQDEMARLEDVVKENECERAGLLTKEKRKEEEIKRLKEDMNKYKKLLEEKAEVLEQNVKDLAYYEKLKEKLETELESLGAEFAEKIKLRDKELDKKHEVIAEMKIAMQEDKEKIASLNEELIREKAWLQEQEEKIQSIQRDLLNPLPPPSEEVTQGRRNLLRTLDIILGLTPESTTG